MSNTFQTQLLEHFRIPVSMPHGISSTFLIQKPPIFLMQLEGKPVYSEQMLNIVEVYFSHFLLFTSLIRNVVEKISAFILFSFT